MRTRFISTLVMLVATVSSLQSMGQSPDTNIALTSPAYSKFTASGAFAHPVRAVDGDIGSAWNAGRSATPDFPVDINVDVGPNCIVHRVVAFLAKSNTSRGLYVCKLRNAKGILIDARHVSRVVSDQDKIEFDFGQSVADVADVVISCEISGGSWVSWREIEIYGKKPLRASTLKRFGYYFGVWSGKDHIDALQTSNVVQIEVGSGGLDGTLKKIKGKKQKALVYMWHFFKDDPVTNTKWATAVPHLKKYEDTIAAFITADEPYHQHRWSTERLEAIAKIVKGDFPSIPIGVNFAQPGIHKHTFAIPQHHDWVSFDYYVYQGASNFEDFLATYNKLQTKLQDHHKFYITADGSILPGGDTRAKQQAAAIRAREYYNWGIRNDKVVLFLPFMWPTAGGLTGTSELPILHRDLDRIGVQISGRRP